MKRVKKENDPQIRDNNTSMVDLPRDLIEKILVKLPVKSIPKLIVVSKLWSSIIRSKHFIDIYLKQSLTRPCFLLSFHRDSIRLFNSVSLSPSSSYTCTTSSFLDYQRLCSQGYNVSPPVRGLICCQDLDKMLVSNPSTGQLLFLPKLNTSKKLGISSFLGYDPVEDEYKVLCMTALPVPYKDEPFVSEEHQVLTLKGGAQKKNKEEATWRMIECKVPHCPKTKGICMTTTATKGVIYYGAWSNSVRDKHESLIVCFDVKLEEFSLVKFPDGVEIESQDQSDLVNYQGKIALLNYSWFQSSFSGKYDMWVLEDVVKPEWSKISIVVTSWDDLARGSLIKCRGAIPSSGEFVFSPSYSASSFFIITYDREKDIGRRVVIEGLGDNLRHLSPFLDHVECPIIL